VAPCAKNIGDPKPLCLGVKELFNDDGLVERRFMAKDYGPGGNETKPPRSIADQQAARSEAESRLSALSVS
jgi:hypothetical protein